MLPTPINNIPVPLGLALAISLPPEIWTRHYSVPHDCTASLPGTEMILFFNLLPWY